MRRFTILTAAFALLAFLAVPLGMRGQTRTEVTWTASEQGYSNGEILDGVSIDLDDYITIQFDKNDGNNPPAYYNTGTAARLYSKNSLTVTPASGYQITEMTLTFSGTSNTGTLGASVGAYSLSSITGTWSGSSTSAIVLTNNASSGHARLQELTVTYSDSGTPVPTTYTVTYDCNGGTSGCPENVTGIEAGTQIQLADAPSRDNYDFDGWSDGTTTYGENEDYTVNGDVTFTAQWTEQSSGDVQWVLTDLADLTDSDVFVIVGNNGGNYAMANDKGTSSAPTAVAVTVENDAITGTVAAIIQWNISGNATEGYTFYPNGTTETWLYCTNTNNGVRVGTNANKSFVINSDYLYNTATSRHIGIYNSQDWRCYSPSASGVHSNIANQTFAFYKKVTGGVLPPSISANNVEITYDATNGSIAYTINNEPDPAGTLTASTESDWLTLGEVGENVPFTCTANESGTERTATVTLTYTYNRETVSKDVTVTQAGDPNATMTIAEVRAQGTGSVVTKGTITSISGNGTKTAYIQDATAAIVVYGSFTAAVGDEIRVSGTLTTYQGLMEITNPTVTVISQGNTIDPELMTIAEINASTNQGWYIRVEDATVTAISGQNTTIAQGDNTILVYGNLGVTVEVNDVVSLNGNIGNHNGVQITNPQNVEVQVAPAVPSVTVTPSEINAPYTETEGALAITYENIPELISFDYYFCDAEGNQLEDTDSIYPTWIYAEINEENETYTLSYIIEENDGEARTAYLKVYTLVGEDEVYAIVTINQEEYVAPTYAELPFAFNSGKAAIEGTDGLSQEGLGSDYGTENTKLKFDGTGDWLLLQFDERPGTLTFDIKGNSFSGSTFTVQTSEDGTTYTDKKVYTELSGTIYDTIADLDAEVRYIKWIYTNKSSGNVGLGNITLAEYVEPVIVASITVNPDVVNVNAEEHDGTLTLAYENLTITEMSDFDIQYYNAEGQEAETPDWIEVLVAEQDPQIGEGYVVSYYMIENEGEARTAYFKVYAMDDETNLVYSNLVTITQEAYETPVEPEDFALFTGDLVEGDYLIVYDVYAMNNFVESGRLQYAEVEAENDVISTDNAAIIWHIARSGEYWTIYSADAQAYAASTGAKNKAQMLADGTDDMALWTVMGTETFEFVNKANAAAGVNANLRNNGTYGFACYSASTGGALTLYKKVTTTATYTLEIAGYGESENGGYRLIASPIYGLNPANVEGMTGDNTDLYYFDQSEEDEWRNYKVNAFHLTPGKGYLYAKSETVDLTFTGMPYEGNGQVALTYDANASFAGWNLIGNPFGQEADVDHSYYRMNPATGAELIPAASSVSVNPMEGIFVVAESEGEVVCFSPAPIPAPPVPWEEDVVLNIGHINGTSTGLVTIDRAIVCFGNGKQLPKFQLNPNSTKIYFTQDTKDYAIVRSANQGEMPVNFKAAENGTYSLSVNAESMEMNYLHLIDNVTGADIDLLQTPNYTFEASTNDYASRFRLVFSANESTSTGSENFAYFNGSTWTVSNIGEATLQVVDMMGRVLSSKTVSGNAEINLNQAAGVYVLRLVNGENVRTQKIVVK